MKKAILEKSIEQKFDHCKEATLYAKPHDLLFGIGIFYKLNIKKITIKCNETDKVIAKKYWNEQTKNTALELKKQLKITKGGWYLMAALVVLLLFSISYAFFQGKIQSENYVTKTSEEKQALRAELSNGDLIRTVDAIYKIESIDKKTIKISKSTISPTNHMNKNIDEEKYKDEVFKNEIIINKQSFIKNGMVNSNLNDEYGGDNIFQILNRK